ncbi:MAG TPA: HEAT repeat domain-containing protein, partial [bacterium]|nr:HEAT repeat domain-containing protein [bacterium]
MLMVTENGAKVPMRADPNFRIIFTQNPAEMQGGRRAHSPALENKFRKIFIRDDFTPEELTRIVSETMPRLAPIASNMVEAHAEALKILANDNETLTLRDLQRWGLIATSLMETKTLSPEESILLGAELVYPGRTLNLEVRDQLQPVLDKLQENIAGIELKVATESHPELRRSIPTDGLRAAIRRALAQDGTFDLMSLYAHLAKEQGMVLELWLEKTLKASSTSEIRVFLEQSGWSDDDKISWIRNNHVSGGIPVLIEYLKHPDAEVRINAAKSLGGFKSSEGIEPLKRLLKDPEVHVRLAAADALINLGATDILRDPHLLAGFRPLVKEDNLFLVMTTLKVLLRTNPREGLWLLQLPEDSLQPRFRATVVTILGEMGFTDAVEALEPLLAHTNDKVAVSAAVALAQFGLEEGWAHLRGALRSPNLDLRSRAMEALVKLGRPEEALEVVETLLQFGGDTFFSAAHLIEICGAKETAKALIPLLSQGERETRWKSAEVLGKLGITDAIPALTALLADSDSDVREMAAQALGRLGAVEVIPLLRSMAKDPHPPTRLRALDALVELGVQEALPEIKTLLTDPEIWIDAAETLDRLAPDWNPEPADFTQIQRLLSEELSHSVAEARGEKATELQRLFEQLPTWRPTQIDRKAEWRESIRRALASESTTDIDSIYASLAQEKGLAFDAWLALLYREAGAEDLRELFLKWGTIDEDYLDFIVAHRLKGGIEWLRSEGLKGDYAVRGKSIAALADLGAVEAIPELRNILESDSGQIAKVQAAESLARLGEDSAAQTLRSWALEPKDLDLKAQALSALGRLKIEVDPAEVLILMKHPKAEQWQILAALDYCGSLAMTETQEAIRALAKDGKDRIQLQAIRVLGELKAAEAIPDLKLLRKNQTPQAAIVTALALTRMGDRSGIEDLKSLLRQAENLRDTVDAIAELGLDEFVPELQSLLNHRSTDVAVHAAIALEKLGFPGAKGALLAQLWQMAGPEPYGKAIRALRELDPEWIHEFPTLQELREILSEELNRGIAEAQGDKAVELQKLLQQLPRWKSANRSEDAFEAKTRALIRQALAREETSSLDSIYEELARAQGLSLSVWLGRSLIGVDSPEKFEAILRSIPWSNGGLAEWIGEHRLQAGHELLLELTGNEDWTVRSAAAESMGNLGIHNPDIEKYLFGLLEDPEWGVRWAAADALKKLGYEDPRIKRTLVTAVFDEDEDIQQSAIESLAEHPYRDREIRDALLLQLGSPNQFVQLQALSTLSRLQIRDESLDRAVGALLQHPEFDIQAEAAALLADWGLGNPEVLGLLTQALASENNHLMAIAGEGLRKLKFEDPVLLGKILDSLKSPEDKVRYEAARMLSYWHPDRPGVRQALERALDDPLQGVALFAADALSHLGLVDSRIEKILIEGLRHSQAELALLSVEALARSSYADLELREALLRQVANDASAVQIKAIRLLDQIDPDWSTPVVKGFPKVQEILAEELRGLASEAEGPKLTETQKLLD